MRLPKKNSKLNSIESLLDIETINQDHVVLKNGDIVAGIKVTPKSLITIPDEEARLVLSRLKTMADALAFELDYGFVFVPNNFSFIENPLMEQYYQEDTTLVQRQIIEADIQKMNAFSQNQYKLVFHITIQGKEETVLKNLEKLYIEMKRALPCSVLKEEDFIHHINHCFDIDNYHYTFGSYKGGEI